MNSNSRLLTLILSIIFALAISLFTIKDSNAYDSKKEWEEGLKMGCEGSVITKFGCAIKGVMGLLLQCVVKQMEFDTIEYHNNCLPNTLPPDEDTYCRNSRDPDVSNLYTASHSVINFIKDNLEIIAGTIVGVFIAMTVFNFIGGVLLYPLYIAIGRDLIMLMGLCVSTYVIPPHEYINMDIRYGKRMRQNTCLSVTPQNTCLYRTKEGELEECDCTKCKVNITDIPFFFHCNKGEYGYIGDLYCTNPILSEIAKEYGDGNYSIISDEGQKSKIKSKIEKEKKYLTNQKDIRIYKNDGSYDSLNSGTLKIFGEDPSKGGVYATDGNNNIYSMSNSFVGSLTVARHSFWNRLGIGDDTPDVITLYRDEIKYGVIKTLAGGILEPDAEIAGFYRLYGGKVQLCAAVSNMWLLPFFIGCTYVAPPIESVTKPISAFESTRCKYFGEGRTDLKSLGLILANDANASKQTISANDIGITYASVPLFLQGDLHITSTIIGCVQDLLYQVVIAPNKKADSSILYQTQKAFKSIILVFLVIYLFSIGIEIITQNEIIKTKDVVTYIIKFCFVLYIGTGNIWYSKNGNGLNLYPALMNTTNEIIKIFMKSSDFSDPLKMCSYPKRALYNTAKENGDDNILLGSNVNIKSISGIQNNNILTIHNTSSPYNDKAESYPNVLLSIWDYIDCKIVNYWNFNSCKYGIDGIMSFWFVGVHMLISGTTGFMLAILSLAYLVLFISIMFSFIQVIIFSLFTVTILVLVTPIMACFFLFEQTKDIFIAWGKNIIGYTLYPGLFFAFIAFMFITLDSVFYGNIKVLDQGIKSNCKDGVCDYAKICSNPRISGSMYCSVMEVIGDSRSLNNCNVTVGNMVMKSTSEESIPLIGGIITTFNDIVILKIKNAMLPLILSVLLFFLYKDAVNNLIRGLLGVHGDFTINASAWSFAKKIGGTMLTAGKKAIDIIRK